MGGRETYRIMERRIHHSRKTPNQQEKDRNGRSKLMFEGKVGAALKFLDEQAENSVLSSTPEVIQKLQSLHPASEDILPNTLFQGPLNEINPAIFYSI